MVKAVKLSDEEIVLCRKAFQTFDKDGTAGRLQTLYTCAWP